MGILTIVRHGQASLHAQDYDQLSPLGEEQSRVLGAYWVQMSHRWDKVWVGPRRRHLQTKDQVAQIYRDQGMDLPEPTEHSAFDEHQGVWVVKAVLENKPGNIEANFVPKEALKNPETKRQFMAQFRDIMRSWVRGELLFPQFESWQAFRQRIATGLEDILKQHQGQERVVLFSSAGPLAAAVGHCLGLDDAAVLELNWPIRNTSLAEFRIGPAGLSLVSFNTLPHLQDPKLLTLV